MKRPTTDQWMGLVLALMAVGILTLSVFDMGGGGATKVREGDPMPAIEGPDLEGGTIAFAEGDSRGKVLLLDFWATWCPPCVAELPILAALHREQKDRGLTLVAINADLASSREKQREIVLRFLAQQKLELPVLLDDGRNQAAYGIRSYPTLIVIGTDGRVSDVFSGLTSRARLEAAIERARARAAPAELTPPA